jgi:hypothetical protein
MMRAQLDALDRAKALIKQLPLDAVWALTLTSDDDGNPSQAAFNIFASNDIDFERSARLMSLAKIVDENNEFTMWLVGSLQVSVIRTEEE